ncbi:MAG: glycine--tRNA ligase subunit alpha [Candidatus Aminicenantes bacterium]|nr:glycine--tRNA ligase subunit alpha [Candidatus Aminicenantes bacterium]NIM78510.1 glycine--tRNA ligase subunit alpha [Candidatus Aminicenantes bacterium]NIN17746.1 glycine--tRNA ligase subunit alpha [Candidatus Aminicenantes bacterium]NIN41647.1 glycine--tRNA ligase subunit alpha [Candidatus Aminicenantes bacterium]NIN84396.1 glycine--tRNA ligase subunit alpha [Candidatus Aminicenantes bacterium]
MSVQDIILKLQEYWANNGCYIASGYDNEVGAGTMTPDTFFRVLGKQPWKVAYWQPSRRPNDGRYAQNPNRVQKHNQFQVILKPVPPDGQILYLRSLHFLGVDIHTHDIKFDEDNWAAPSLGAWGVGWQVMCDGLEITQFTYFQQAGGIELNPNSLEITYGIDRLAAFLDVEDSIYHLEWGNRVTYSQLRTEEERQFSIYNFEYADIQLLRNLYNQYQKEATRLVAADLYLPAFDYVLKCSHTFNILDARKAVSVAERNAFMATMRNLANQIAKKYIEATDVESESEDYNE